MQEQWGVNMYGLFLNDLDLKEGVKIQHMFNKLLSDMVVVLPNGKQIILSGEYFQDSCRHAIGFGSIYPWNFPSCTITKEDVEEAVYIFLKPFTNMKLNNICGLMKYISLPNSGYVADLDENGEWRDPEYGKEEKEQGA